ncbi:MAG: response regulator [Chitinophagaceae bacterium]
MSKSILLIDDDSRNIFALSVLNAKNLTCVSASCMKDAFSILTNNSSGGIILIDMMMPETDGYEAWPALKLYKQY